MAESKWKKGQVVQIRPGANEWFDGCFMIITEPKSWGAQGFVQVPGKEGGQAYVRLKDEDMELIGKAVWVPEGEADDGETNPAD